MKRAKDCIPKGIVPQDGSINEDIKLMVVRDTDLDGPDVQDSGTALSSFPAGAVVVGKRAATSAALSMQDEWRVHPAE